MRLIKDYLLISWVCSAVLTLVPTVSATAAANCGKVLSVGQLIRSAQHLQGQIVCVRGILLISNSYDDVPLVAEELLSPEQIARGSADAVGLISWSPETGVPDDLFKPESEELLTNAQARCKRACVVDVTFLGGVMYQKRMLEKIRKMFEGKYGVGWLPGTQRDVELVTLQVVKVNRIVPYRKSDAK